VKSARDGSKAVSFASEEGGRKNLSELRVKRKVVEWGDRAKEILGGEAPEKRSLRSKVRGDLGEEGKALPKDAASTPKGGLEGGEMWQYWVTFKTSASPTHGERKMGSGLTSSRGRCKNAEFRKEG